MLRLVEPVATGADRLIHATQVRASNSRLTHPADLVSTNADAPMNFWPKMKVTSATKS
jgi:hypothetical protein